LARLQFGGDGEELGAVRVWPPRHHLISSSTQERGSLTRVEQPVSVNGGSFYRLRGGR
jgi:hypothetical protein